MSVKSVLIATRSLPFHSLGGMEIITWDLAKAFTRLGLKVTILTTACPALPEHSDRDGVHIHTLPVPTGRYSKAWWRQSGEVYKATYASNVDVVLSVSAGAMGMAKVRKSGQGPAFFAQAHGTSWGEFISKIKQGKPVAFLKSARNLIGMIEDVGFRHFDGFIAVGEVVRRDLISAPTCWITGGLPVEVIANGVDEAHFAFCADLRARVREKFGLSDSDKAILSASRLHPQKGVYEGIEGFALALKTDPRLHYIIAGSGPDEVRLKARAQELGVEGRVHFAGAVPRHDLRSFYSAADLFLFTTKRIEGLPMNLLEALASGLPIVASKHISAKDFDVSIVDPMDINEISKSIIQNMRTSERRARLPSIYSLDECSRKYVNIFNQN